MVWYLVKHRDVYLYVLPISQTPGFGKLCIQKLVSITLPLLPVMTAICPLGQEGEQYSVIVAPSCPEMEVVIATGSFIHVGPILCGRSRDLSPQPRTAGNSEMKEVEFMKQVEETKNCVTN
jgi:hypothetical protein